MVDSHNWYHFDSEKVLSKTDKKETIQFLEAQQIQQELIGRTTHLFREFLQSFNIGADIRISNVGELDVKVTEYPFNLRFQGKPVH